MNKKGLTDLFAISRFECTSQKEEAQIVHRIHKQHGNTRCICMKIEYGLNQSHVLFLSK